jgi:hypothetical protein
MAGSQMSYGDAQRGFRHVGEYVGRFLKGDKPDDLQQSTIAELVIFETAGHSATVCRCCLASHDGTDLRSCGQRI